MILKDLLTQHADPGWSPLDGAVVLHRRASEEQGVADGVIVRDAQGVPDFL
jgi:hypothetical protein